jgi:hypothetical protein
MTSPPAVLARTSGPTHIALRNYPFVTVRVACYRCERQERFNKDRLIEEYGADATMFDLRPRIVACEERHRAGQSCEIFYPDLANND